jgi:hypothetical protein
MSRKSVPCERVDMTAVDEIMARVLLLNAPQRAVLDSRLLALPGLVRSCFTVSAYLHREELKMELPLEVRAIASRFWSTIDAVCRREERRPDRMAPCCRRRERWAKQSLVRK